MVSIKSWYKSSTIIVNIIAVVIPILDMVLKTNLIADKDIYAIIIAIVNILNRFRVTPENPVQPVAKKLI